MTDNALTLASRDDVAALRAGFASAGRIKIPAFLMPADAKRLRDTLLGLDWRTVLNEGDKHFDIHPEQAKLLGPEKLNVLKRGATIRARSEFQYLYENFPVHEALAAGTPIAPDLAASHALMNSAAVRDLIAHVTDIKPDFCDMQATRYRAGHFLTKHNDDVDGKNRRFAYVLGLSQRWRGSWGGNLEFLAPDGAVTDSFTPRFNTLSLFQVPMDHRVTSVTPAAASSRISLTGWFRMAG